jgi:hypothetical protein
MSITPGTVSKILWHFTGGPKWNEVSKCQNTDRKPINEAYDALLGILRSRRLCLGNYRELINVRVPTRRFCATLIEDTRPDWRDVIYQSSPVCCVTDIPIAHLSYHASRYGKIAVGFHREAAIRAGFNPVFYALHDAEVLRSLHETFAELDNLAPPNIDASDVVREVETLKCKEGHTVDLDGPSCGQIESAIEDISAAAQNASSRLEQFLAFVKTFASDQLSTIYCEREWRSTKPFSFTLSDVAMIVLPKAGNDKCYFDEFVSHAKVTRLPRSIPIVPWEDLIEH